MADLKNNEEDEQPGTKATDRQYHIRRQTEAELPRFARYTDKEHIPVRFFTCSNSSYIFYSEASVIHTSPIQRYVLETSSCFKT